MEYKNRKVRLISDFVDYYDHWFDGYDSELIFRRLSKSGMSRPDMLRFLKEKGFATPAFGTVKDLYDEIIRKQYHDTPGFDSILSVVVYTDIFSHRGEGKLLLPFNEAIEKYPDHFATEYLCVQKNGLGLSYRYLKIGQESFWLQYSSENDWRSNYGEVNVTILFQQLPIYHAIDYPLYAIDFLPIAGTLYAIDFNIAPQIKGTGIEDILPAKKVADLIKIELLKQKGETIVC
jgi:hypothetical protein